MTGLSAFPALPGRTVGAPVDGARRLLLRDVRLHRSGPADPVEPVAAEPLDVHLDRLGPRPLGDPRLVDLLEAAGLTGHGGAHVAAALRWRAVAAGAGPLTVVANGAESEPVAGKDGTLLRQRPHLVLDGLMLAAESLGAHRAVVWLHGDDEGGRRALLAALAERRWSDSRLPVEVLTGPVHYLAGESSAITRAVQGGPALPTVRRRPSDPRAPRTLVHNVETLARLALLARGHAPASTRLLSVLGAHRVVVEVEQATTFGQLLAGLGWPAAPQAVLLGGYGGLWAPWERMSHLPVDERALRAEGLTLGAGVVLPLAAGACGLGATADLVDYLASMSARQCGPCRFGLPALADSWRALAEGRDVLGQVLDDAGAVEGRGACHHPDGATRLVASAVATFEADVAAHRTGRPCVAGGSGPSSAGWSSWLPSSPVPASTGPTPGERR
ncbi:Ion-translocating oxidoreductase complex subunit C [Cellulomonas sp. T2.31MG-18]|uniref:NADH-ubiquinone oxidoreductase-F iron-sulfur binding region domain-containing protein n=1 Tax=Cellulomonas sp. T2.31MG-18 TaxID=3157619 RepID=UPI0035E7E831